MPQPHYLTERQLTEMRRVYDGDKRTITLPVSTQKKNLELDTWFSGRVESLDFCNERHPPVGPFINQTKSGEHLPRHGQKKKFSLGH